jgi:hypothetical protein
MTPSESGARPRINQRKLISAYPLCCHCATNVANGATPLRAGAAEGEEGRAHLDPKTIRSRRWSLTFAVSVSSCNLASGEFDKVSANIAWRGIVAGRLYRTGRGIGVEVPGTDKVAAISISQKDIDRKATEALTGRRGRLVFGFSERTSDSPLQAIKSRGCSGSRTAGFSRGEDRFGSTASCEPGFAATARRESIDSRHKGKPVRHPGQTSLTQEDDHGGSSSDGQLDAATRAL